ncbi:MAG TPA: 2-C-methyl-D-erythritol 4-phosphate cytidylyltransferase [Chthoniobacteraceae bacterium]|jgi:2-C-methyl-D-erythritol 4-phosphate cytidylyltransferase|nr:2-C-methyl-D-erythritol 4-phosphate cytidylyltransferase [Chthoniobacteraceae bacterium]
MVSAVIVAAGSSRRMGFDKLFASLGGKPVLAHSVAAFESTPEIGEIVLVIRPEQKAPIEGLIASEGWTKVKRLVEGGAERHFSVWGGLQAVNGRAAYVAIHDGARPLTTPAVIRQCLEMARNSGAACVASPIPDTVKRADDKGHVTASVERCGLWAMQTPQIFSTPIILQAYAAVIGAGELVTDEVSAVQKLGVNIALLRNDEWNFKITIPRDLELAEHVLASRAAI